MSVWEGRSIHFDRKELKLVRPGSFQKPHSIGSVFGVGPGSSWTCRRAFHTSSGRPQTTSTEVSEELLHSTEARRNWWFHLLDLLGKILTVGTPRPERESLKQGTQEPRRTTTTPMGLSHPFP